MALNTRRIEESVWAPPPGEVTTLVAVTAGTWPAGTRLLVGDPPDTPATATVLGSSVVSADGLTATWALSEADCAILRTHTRFMVQVPSGAAWEGILAGTVNLEPAWSGGRAVQRLGTVMVGPQGPAGTVADATSSVKGVVALAGDLAGTAAAPTVPGLAGKAAAVHTHAPGDVTGTAVITTDPRLADARTPTAHAGTHATGGTDALTPAAIGAQPAGSYAAALGADDNYVTDAEKVKLTNLSGTNTGDQTLPTWGTIAGKPAVIAAGADAVAARAAIGAGTSSLVLGTIAGTAKAGDYAPDLSALAVKANNLSDLTNAATARTNLGLGTAATTAATAYATAAQGTKADTALQPSTVTAKGDLLAATGASTLARLPVGADGQVLTADAASAAGVKWAAGGGGAGHPALSPVSLTTGGGDTTGWQYPAGWGTAVPLLVPASFGFTSISLTQGYTPASATGAWRLARYTLSGASLVKADDYGLFTGSGEGVEVVVTGSWTMPAGWCWLVCVQDSGTARLVSAVPAHQGPMPPSRANDFGSPLPASISAAQLTSVFGGVRMPFVVCRGIS